MKFFVEKTTRTSGRLGQVLITARCHDYKLKTPMLLLTTHTGSVPHFTKDVLELVLASSKTKDKQVLTTGTGKNIPVKTPDVEASSHVFSVPVVDFIGSHDSLLAYGKGVAAFAGLPDYSVLATAHSSLCAVRSGYNSSQGISLWSHSGRVTLKPNE
ncbi:hypothetical protein FHG87_021963 [Trinorchestia longiramus]|nr:hypothetical protein FHG87_021963 [Trinorchestia longiramus]